MAVSYSWNEGEFEGDLAAAIEEGLFEAAEVLLGHANQLVPLDEGPLMNSGTAEIRDGKARVGFNTPYALMQHENLNYTHAAGRTAKYLEKPLNALGPDLEQIVGSALERRLGL
ncbi:hypothetical protein [Nocardia salmonicida]|uniref:hypothetical protein n=1 Tax=Nocardia salmonicida TaxID=53431 RepID=UPI00363BC276